MDNKGNVILGVLLLIIASATLFVVYQSFQVAEQTREIAEQTREIAEQTREIAEQTREIADQSNEITERVYEILYLSSLPTISAISETYYDSEEHLWTEKIMVYNGGEPLKEFGGSTYAIMVVRFSEMDMKTYIPLRGYFVRDEYSGNSRGLLLTTFREYNYSDYRSISRDFRQAASEDGYEPSIWRTHILLVYYNDYSGQHWREYFDVDSSGCQPLDESDAREILDSADGIRELAESAGLSLYIWSLDGQELWDWYKEEILQD